MPASLDLAPRSRSSLSRALRAPEDAFKGILFVVTETPGFRISIFRFSSESSEFSSEGERLYSKNSIEKQILRRTTRASHSEENPDVISPSYENLQDLRL